MTERKGRDPARTRAERAEHGGERTEHGGDGRRHAGVNDLRRLRRALLLPLVPVLALVAGCSLLPPPFSSPAAGSAQAAVIGARQRQWEALGVPSYRWRVSYLCECPGGTFEVTVIDGAITGVVDASGAAIAVRMLPLTVDALFAQALSTVENGGTVDAAWDPATGIPRSMNMDPVLDAIDDELSMTLESFDPLG